MMPKIMKEKKSSTNTLPIRGKDRIIDVMSVRIPSCVFMVRSTLSTRSERSPLL